MDLPCLLYLHPALNCKAVHKWRQKGREKGKLKKVWLKTSEVTQRRGKSANTTVSGTQWGSTEKRNARKEKGFFPPLYCIKMNMYACDIAFSCIK